MLEINEIMEKEKYIFRVARKLMKNGMDADDVAQDALVKAITRRHQYDPTKAALTTWLYQIVFNEAMQFFNRTKRAIGDVEKLELISDDEEYELEGVMSASELTNEAYKRVVELAHQDTSLVKYDLVDTFIEYYSMGKGLIGHTPNHKQTDKYMTFYDIAENTGIHVNTLRTMFRRARLHIAYKMRKNKLN